MTIGMDFHESWTRIPMPSLLADSRVHQHSRDPERRSDTRTGPTPDFDVDWALDYARKLWSVLDQAARYLAEDVARGTSSPQLQSLLTTEEQWQRWRDHYAAILGVLTGPVGDEGYGEHEARLEYQNCHVSRQN